MYFLTLSLLTRWLILLTLCLSWEGREYNVVSDVKVSKYDFGCELASIFGLEMDLVRPISIRSRKDLIRRPLDMSLSNKKVSGELNANIGSVKSELSKLYSQKFDYRLLVD